MKLLQRLLIKGVRRAHQGVALRDDLERAQKMPLQRVARLQGFVLATWLVIASEALAQPLPSNPQPDPQLGQAQNAGPSLPPTAAPTVRRHPVTNQQGPVHLRWFALAEFATPGAGGLRLGAHSFLPVIPVYLEFQFARDWGSEVIHAAGKYSWTDFMAGTMTWETKVGLFRRVWKMIKRDDLTVFAGSEKMGDYVIERSDVYSIKAPVEQTTAIYAGFRSRSVPGSVPCGPTDEGLTEDCERSSSPFVMLGVNWLEDAQFDAQIAKRGSKRWAWGKAWDVHLLYAADGERYGRSSVLRRVGLEVQLQQHSPDGGVTLLYGAGWDGRYALLQFGMGYGRSHSFQSIKPIEEIYNEAGN